MPTRLTALLLAIVLTGSTLLAGCAAAAPQKTTQGQAPKPQTSTLLAPSPGATATQPPPTDSPAPEVPVASALKTPEAVYTPAEPVQTEATAPAVEATAPAAGAVSTDWIRLENLPALSEVARLGTGRAVSLAWSPDRQAAVVATWNGAAVLRIPSLELSRQVLPGVPILKAGYAPDGQTLLVLTRDGKFQGVRVSDGKVLREVDLAADQAPLQSGTPLAINPARYLAAVSLYDFPRARTTLRIRKASAAESLELQVEREITALAFSEDGTLLAAGAQDRNILLFETQTGTERKACRFHTRAVVSLAFSPDGARLLSGGLDNSVRVCDLARQTQVFSLPLKTPLSLVRYASGAGGMDAADGADAALGLTVLQDGSLQLWNAGDGKHPAALEGHRRTVRDAAFSPDGASLLTLSDDGTLGLWDPAQAAPAPAKPGPSRAVTTLFPAPVTAVDISPDRQVVAAGYEDGAIRLWSVPGADLLQELRAPEGADGPVGRVLFSASGKSLVSLEGKLVRRWDPRSGSLVRTYAGHQNDVLAAAFSPDETLLASGSADRTVRIWDLSSDEDDPLRTLSAFNHAVADVRFGEGGVTLMTMAWDQAMQTWNVADGKLLATRHGGPGENTTAVIYPPDSRLLAAISDGAARVWWREDFSERWACTDSLVSALTFSSSGDLLVTGGHSLRFWDFKTGALARELPTASWISAVQFSNDGSLLVSADRESGIISFWRIIS